MAACGRYGLHKLPPDAGWCRHQQGRTWHGSPVADHRAYGSRERRRGTCGNSRLGGGQPHLADQGRQRIPFRPSTLCLGRARGLARGQSGAAERKRQQRRADGGRERRRAVERHAL